MVTYAYNPNNVEMETGRFLLADSLAKLVSSKLMRDNIKKCVYLINSPCFSLFSVAVNTMTKSNSVKKAFILAYSLQSMEGSQGGKSRQEPGTENQRNAAY